MQICKNILFDLDGTIIESQEGITNSIIYALTKLGINDYDQQDLRKFIGPPLFDSFRSYYRMSEREADVAVTYYREYYASRGVHENTLYDYVGQMLEQLYRQGYHLFVATSKPTIFARQILEHFNLSALFGGIEGSNLDHSRREKAEVIAHVLKTYAIAPEESMMVGDRKYDVLGARCHSIKTVGVTYGHGTIQELQWSGAHHIVDDCRALELYFSGKSG